MVKPLVIYDGECGICAGSLPWLHRLDWLKRFDALPYQSSEVYERFPQVKRENCEKELCVAFSDGRAFGGGRAFREIFLRMPLTFLLGVLMFIPPVMYLTNKLYPILARNRYKLGGHCPIDPAKRDPPH